MQGFAVGLLGAFCIVGASCGAWAQAIDPAQAYPAQAVRIIVPFSAGSITDLLARSLGDKLSESWHQPVIVESRPGIPGTAAAAIAAPDGYTLALVSNGHSVIGSIHNNLSFDPVRDFAGVSKVASIPQVLIVPPSSPVKTLAELIALARQRPGALNYASAGLGSTSYIAAEVFKRTAGIDLTHVPYRGAPESLTSVMRGDTQLFFAPASVAVELIRAGKVRPIAVVASERNPALPQVPTFAEAGLPDFVYDAWIAILAPAKTPRAIIDKANRDIAQALRQPELAERLSQQGMQIATGTPEQLEELVRTETVRFGQMIGEAGRK